MPAPNTPSAKPCRSGGYQTETQAIPTANDTPARPTKNASTSSSVYPDARLMRYVGIAVARSSAVKTSPPTDAIGEDPERHAEERPGEDRDRDEQRELPLVEVELLLDRDRDDREHHPHREEDAEPDRRHHENASPDPPLLLGADSNLSFGA